MTALNDPAPGMAEFAERLTNVCLRVVVPAVHYVWY